METESNCGRSSDDNGHGGQTCPGIDRLAAGGMTPLIFSRAAGIENCGVAINSMRRRGKSERPHRAQAEIASKLRQWLDNPHARNVSDDGSH